MFMMMMMMIMNTRLAINVIRYRST